MAKNKAALAAALLLTGSLAALPALFLARGRAARSLPPSSFAAASAPARAAQAPAAGPGSAAAQDWQTRLVSAAHPLPEDFSVCTAPVEHYPDRRFDARAVDALNALLNGAQKAGLPLYLVSAWRSPARQQALFARKVAWYLRRGYDGGAAERQAARWVARPGTSEHNLGLAADLVSARWYENHDDLTEEFAATPEYAWLCAHCAEYGFVLRYPPGKAQLTGVTYEPWHFRYVGRRAAQLLTSQGLCLEELPGQTR